MYEAAGKLNTKGQRQLKKAGPGSSRRNANYKVPFPRPTSATTQFPFLSDLSWIKQFS